MALRAEQGGHRKEAERSVRRLEGGSSELIFGYRFDCFVGSLCYGSLLFCCREFRFAMNG